MCFCGCITGLRFVFLLLVCSWFIAWAALLLLQVQIRSREGTRLVFCVVLVEWQAWERQRELGLCCFAQKKKRCWKERKVRGKKEDVNSVRPSFFFFCVLALRKLRRTVWREKVLHWSPHFSSSTIWFLALLYFLCLFHFRPSFLLSFFFSFSFLLFFFFFCSHKSNKILKKSQTHEKLTKG